MKATVNMQEQGSGREILGNAPGSFKAPARRQGQRGFTLVELLAVMAIIGILAGVVAGAVSGLGATGVNAQIVSDTKTIETSADRFFSDSFPQVYPVLPLERDLTGAVIDPLVEGAGNLGVFLIDFDARLPQDPTKTFTPDFIKDIPNSAALVSYRIDESTGNVFAAADGAQLIRPSAGRVNVFTGNRAASPATLGSTDPKEVSDYSFVIKMKKNQSSPKIMTMEIPALYSLGGSSVPVGTVMGTLKIVYSTDNPWDPGQIITKIAPIVVTGEADNWVISLNYDLNTSSGINPNVDVKNVPEAGETVGPNDVRVHSLQLVAPTEDTPGKMTLTMDRTTETGSAPNFTTVHTDPAHNEATETWTMVIFAHPQESINDATEVSPEVNIFTNPSVNKVYRWLARETTTISVEGVFKQIAGKQAIIVKGDLDAVTLASIAVAPVEPAVEAGQTKQFTASGTFSDDTQANPHVESPLTGVKWLALTPAKATISPTSGLATVDHLASGTAIFTASRDRKTVTFTLTVTADVTNPTATVTSITENGVTVTFSEPILKTTLNTSTFTVFDNDAPATVASTSFNIAEDGLSATFGADLTAGVSYQVVLSSGITDLNGLALIASSTQEGF